MCNFTNLLCQHSPAMICEEKQSHLPQHATTHLKTILGRFHITGDKKFPKNLFLIFVKLYATYRPRDQSEGLLVNKMNSVESLQKMGASCHSEDIQMLRSRNAAAHELSGEIFFIGETDKYFLSDKPVNLRKGKVALKIW